MADFTDFQSAVAKADVSLKSFETGAGKVSAALSKMGDSFSGRVVIQNAELATKAVADIGGATKLTESEQAKLNVQLNEAISKYKALGLDAPKAMTDLADATKKIEPPMSLSAKAAGLLGSAFGQFTAAGLATQAISKLTSGLGEFAAQGLKLPGLQNSFDRLTKGIGQNGAAMLASMGSATEGLVSDIGLIQSANKAMLLGLPVTAASMGELAHAATTLGRAMGEDATKSLDDLITALGRSSPMILDNLGLSVKVSEANEVYANKLHKSADALTDAEKKMAFYEAAMEAARKKTEELGAQTKTLGERMETVWTKIGNVVSATAATFNVGLGRATSSLKEFAQFLSDAEKFGIATAVTMAKLRADIDALAAAQHRAADIHLTTPAQELAALRKEAEALRNEAIKPLTKDQRELVIAFDAGGKSAQQIAEKLKINEEAVKLTLEANKKAKTASDEYKKAVKELQEALTPLTEEQKKSVTLLDAQGVSAEKMAKALKVSATAIDKFLTEAQDEAKASLEEYNEEIRRHNELQREGEQASLAAIAKQEKEEFDAAQAALDDYNESVRHHKELQKEGEDATLAALAATKKSASESAKAIGDVAQALSQLSQVSGGSFSEIVSGFAQIVTAADTAEKSVKAISSALSKDSLTGKGKGLEGILQMAGGLLGLASAAIQAGKAIAGLFDRSKGRDLVVDFASTLGGFDALHDKLAMLGADGEKLWIALTQGVGRNDPKAAQAAIDAVTKALDDFGVAQGKAQEDSAAAIAAKAAHLQSVQADAIKDILSPAEAGALSKAYRIEVLKGFEGTETDFLAKQLEYYQTLQEGDARLKTWFTGSTLSAFNLLKSGNAELFVELTGQIDKINGEYQSLADSIAGEAPEEFMGAVERETRDRMAALAEQRNKIEDELQQQQADTQDAVEDVGSSVGDVTSSAEDALSMFQQWADAIDNAGASLGRLSWPSMPSPDTLPFSAGSAGSSKVQIVAPVYLDGNVVAENTSYHLLN